MDNHRQPAGYLRTSTVRAGHWEIRVYSDATLQHETATIVNSDGAPRVSTPDEEAQFAHDFYVSATLTDGALSVGSGLGT